ncbi:unnamed protein product [Phyllotreta striolata]|uniref:Major facilitator superfamily (MFS) profile domain-containing protein n=1 Tax=Phyllotreta striolata TaxID=444603 RepID=A0A9N9XJF5_PHYSR|nr:unnamed protein product [Phyllotreta striolata]
MPLKICANFNWILYISTFAANLSFLTYGIILAWNAPTLAKFRSNNTEINPLGEPLAALQLSICTSILPVASIVAALGVCKLPDIIGRRKSLIYILLLILAGFVLVSFVKNFWLYCLIYFVICSGVAASSIISPTYTAEISEASNRGMVCCFSSIGKTVGQLYIFVLSPVTNFRYLSICCAIPSLIFLLISYFIPESPIFLSMKGREREALVALKAVRINSKRAVLQTELKEKQDLLQSKGVKDAFKILFKTRAGKRAFFLTLLVRTCCTTTGINVTLAFVGDFLTEPVNPIVSPDNVAIILIISKIITAIFCSTFTDKLGRRVFLITGCFLSSASTCCIGVYYLCKQYNLNFPDSVRIIPTIAIFVFFIGYTLGFSGITYTLLSELLPNEARTLGSGLVICISNVTLFIVSFCYPLITKYLGVHYCMFMFSFMSAISFILLYIFIPETNGKSFSEIRTMLTNSKM